MYPNGHGSPDSPGAALTAQGQPWQAKTADGELFTLQTKALTIFAVMITIQ